MSLFPSGVERIGLSRICLHSRIGKAPRPAVWQVDRSAMPLFEAPVRVRVSRPLDYRG